MNLIVSNKDFFKIPHLHIYTQTLPFQTLTALPSHTQTHTADYGMANRDRLCLNNPVLQEFFQRTKMSVLGSQVQWGFDHLCDRGFETTLHVFYSLSHDELTPFN